jgi:hypothetical protein
MRRFVFRPEEREPHRFEREASEMCDRLAEAGYEVPFEDFCRAWDAYSESVCATWISADDLDGDEIMRRISSYVEEVDGPSGPDL